MLKILQEEPMPVKFGANEYKTAAGQGPNQEKADNSLEAHDPKFFDENKYWLLSEIDRYLGRAKQADSPNENSKTLN